MSGNGNRRRIRGIPPRGSGRAASPAGPTRAVGYRADPGEVGPGDADQGSPEASLVNLEMLRERLAEVGAEVTARLTDAGLIDTVENVAIDIFDEEKEFVAVAEFPGLSTRNDIVVEINDRELLITGVTPRKQLRGTATLSAEVRGTYTVGLQNGIVEVRIPKKEEG